MMDIKDRIRIIMEEQHMTQQVFADFLQQSPATLSSIFNGRTRPTLNVVDAIKTKIPDISIDWLLYGTGDMHTSHAETAGTPSPTPQPTAQEAMINFDVVTPPYPSNSQSRPMERSFSQGVQNTPSAAVREEVKIINKPPRRVTEIRVYYDDHTYETFAPSPGSK